MEYAGIIRKTANNRVPPHKTILLQKAYHGTHESVHLTNTTRISGTGGSRTTFWKNFVKLFPYSDSASH